MSFAPAPKTNTVPLTYGLIISLLLHGLGIAFFTFQLKHDHTLEEPQVLQVTLVSAPKTTKTPVVVKEASAPKPEPIKTQASAAPPEPPKPVVKQKPIPTPTKVVQAEKAKPKPLPKKEVEPPKKRPPVLDRTPEKKKVIKSLDPDAKTVKPPDDFLAALDFVDDLKADAKKADVEQVLDETSDSNVELSFADQSLVGKLKEHIEDFWLRPPGLRVDELGTVVEVRLKPDGTIASMEITESSGQLFYDNSIKRAIRKAQPLPIPIGKYEIFKVLELYFKG